MVRVRISEYGCSRAVRVSRAQVEALLPLAKRLRLSPAAGRPGCYDITATSYVGTVTVGDLEIEIVPKVPIGNLLFLLGYAVDRQHILPLPAGVDVQDSIHEAAGLYLEVMIRRAFARGVLQGYRAHEDALMTLRGRPRFDEQLRQRPLQLLPMECGFDEFTEDTEMNRVLRAAIQLVLDLRLRSRELQRRLRGHDHELERVARVRYSPGRLPSFTYSRLNEHYRPAVELALMLLRAQAPEVRAGDVQVRALLFDMNRVFEDFLLVGMRDALGVDTKAFPSQAKGRRLFLDAERGVPLEPDLSWWQGERCVWVGDAKYKRVSNAAVPNADVYQAVSYCLGTGLREATLIYAQGVEDARRHSVESAGVAVQLAPFDLTLRPDQLLAQVRGLAAAAKARAAGVASLRA